METRWADAGAATHELLMCPEDGTMGAIRVGTVSWRTRRTGPHWVPIMSSPFGRAVDLEGADNLDDAKLQVEDGLRDWMARYGLTPG